MSPARTVFAALALTTFLACGSALEPEVSVDAFVARFGTRAGSRILLCVRRSG